MSALTNKVTRGIGKVKLTTIKYSPEILLAAGIISGAATIFLRLRRLLISTRKKSIRFTKLRKQ